MCDIPEDASFEDRNYYRDARVRAKFVPQPPDGVAFHWEVCPLCHGRGKVVNPSIDANGLTAEDFDQDPDFREAYMTGVYDICCPRCRGRTTVPVIDDPNYDPDTDQDDEGE